MNSAMSKADGGITHGKNVQDNSTLTRWIIPRSFVSDLFPMGQSRLVICRRHIIPATSSSAIPTCPPTRPPKAQGVKSEASRQATACQGIHRLVRVALAHTGQLTPDAETARFPSAVTATPQTILESDSPTAENGDHGSMWSRAVADLSWGAYRSAHSGYLTFELHGTAHAAKLHKLARLETSSGVVLLVPGTACPVPCEHSAEAGDGDEDRETCGRLRWDSQVCSGLTCDFQSP